MRFRQRAVPDKLKGVSVHLVGDVFRIVAKNVLKTRAVLSQESGRQGNRSRSAVCRSDSEPARLRLVEQGHSLEIQRRELKGSDEESLRRRGVSSIEVGDRQAFQNICVERPEGRGGLQGRQ